MSFSISFLNETVSYPYDDEGTPAIDGILVLGEFREHFQASLHQWSKLDYEAHWRDAVKTVLEGSKSALIVEYVSPEFATHLVWWPMYRVGEAVYIQNHLLFYDQLTAPFSLENIFSFVRERQTVSEDGNPTSEWNVNLSEVEGFGRTLPIYLPIQPTHPNRKTK